jgi:hypothetical protein
MLQLADWRSRNCGKLPNFKYTQSVEFGGVPGRGTEEPRTSGFWESSVSVSSRLPALESFGCKPAHLRLTSIKSKLNKCSCLPLSKLFRLKICITAVSCKGLN